MSQSSEQLLSVRDLKKHFPIGGGLFQRHKAQLKAVDGVSFTLQRGETLGLVGESGCGKTTAGRVILRLLEPTSGSVTLTTSLQEHEPRQEHDIFSLKKETLRLLRRQMQIVFQDPYGSLNPRMTVGTLLREPLIIHNLAPRNELDDQQVDYLVVGIRCWREGQVKVRS